MAALTYWDQETHICVGKLTIKGIDNGLSPGRHQAIIWTIAGLLLIEPLKTSFSIILTEMLIWEKYAQVLFVQLVIPANKKLQDCLHMK